MVCRVYHNDLGVAQPSHADSIGGSHGVIQRRAVSGTGQVGGYSPHEAEVTEVAERFESLLRELEGLTQLDLAQIQPVFVFPEEEASL